MQLTVYSQDDVSSVAINAYLNAKLSSDDRSDVMSPITLEEIPNETKKRIMKVSSPGEDDLGYAFLNQIIRFPIIQPMIVDIFNQSFF